MNTDTNLDRYGLSKDDEFHGLSFVQVSDEKTIEVKPYTYALMTWWKCVMDQSDTIDISDDGDMSILTWDVTVNGGDDESNTFTSEDEIDVDSILEVREGTGLVNHYIYLKTPLTEEVAAAISVEMLNINPEIQFGRFEVYSPSSGEYHFIRYRAETILDGIKVGKVNAIGNLYTHSYLNFTVGLNQLFSRNMNYKELLIQD